MGLFKKIKAKAEEARDVKQMWIILLRCQELVLQDLLLEHYGITHDEFLDLVRAKISSLKGVKK